MAAALARDLAAPLASNGSFLIKPGVGLMVWTLLVFGITMVLLSKLAFPRISEALERRQKAIEESIDTAERTRAEAEQILSEYRERLKEAREQADEIIQRARQTAEAHEREAKERGQELVAEASQQDLEAVRAAGKKLQINVLGLASIAEDVSPELALATIDSVVVLGAFRASSEVKAALAGRIT